MFLIKRFVNSGNAEAVQCIREISTYSPKYSSVNILGYMPAKNAELQEKFMEKLVGKYMGSNPKKGASYAWVPNHIQDSNGLIAPRSFLKCFAISAERMLENESELKNLEADRLLSPSSLQGALIRVSDGRVREISESYPWLETLKQMLNGLHLLTERQEVERRINIDQWTNEQKKCFLENSPPNIRFFRVHWYTAIYVEWKGQCS